MAQDHPQSWSWELPLNLHHHDHHLYQVEQEEGQHEREHMFEKPLTPSDVGKLNRLVIPKQHAEKYFPLDGGSGERGLLLSFEDESGKTWQFRYSYWTSSQSYVLTKGWSRFVKEKRLDAGDVVLFERCPWCRGEQLYIRCRRRGANETMANATCSYPTSGSCFSSMQQHCLLHARDQKDEAVAPANSTRLRLFGVNLDCRPEPEPEPQPMSSTSWFLGQGACQFMPTNYASRSQLNWSCLDQGRGEL